MNKTKKKKKNQEQCRDYIENVKLIWVLYFYGVIIIIFGCVRATISAHLESSKIERSTNFTHFE